MKILFIHQNFPGQFKHLSAELAGRGHDVRALTLRVSKPGTWHGVQLIPYSIDRKGGQKVHPWLVDLDTKITRGEACYRAACGLSMAGYEPDVIIAHPGWGESLFLRDLWPEARLGIYCEFFNRTDYPYSGFDPEFAHPDPMKLEPLRMRMKNLHNFMQFDSAQAGVSPTHFQADTFPPELRDRIEVIHDGIDTDVLAPDPAAQVKLADGRVMTRDDEVITFVNRNLEPYRGYHVFMRSLPELLRSRPDAQILIVGGDGTSYGAPPPKGKTWKQIYIDEVRARIPDADWARVHFLGRIPYDVFTAMLKLARVHVYLTYPFVLSWSLLEAMSCGVAIVASDTAPVREALDDGVTGRLVDFFDAEGLARTVAELSGNTEERARLGAAARAHAIERYDLKTVCLPAQLDWVARLVGQPV